MAVTSFDQPNNNPNYPANSTMVQEVIKHLPNEEALTKLKQLMSISHQLILPGIAVTCYNCGESSHPGLIANSAPGKSECAESKDHTGQSGVMMRWGWQSMCLIQKWSPQSFFNSFSFFSFFCFFTWEGVLEIQAPCDIFTLNTELRRLQPSAPSGPFPTLPATNQVPPHRGKSIQMWVCNVAEEHAFD